MSDLSFLRSLEPFKTLSRADAKRLLANTHKETFASGARIVRKGDPGTAMYVILDGQVEIPVVAEDGRVRFVAYLKPGEVFGEMALLTGAPRTADVVVPGGPCECLVIEKAVLDDVLQRHPHLAAFLTEILGQRLIEANAMRQVGKYHILGEMGRGAMATVYEGYHPLLNRGVAIKMLSHSMVYRADFAARFRNEAKLLANLRHEGIVQVYDIEAAYGTYFIVMEKLEGTDLERFIAQHGPLDFNDTRKVVLQVARALEYAHGSGIVHRDVKPSNVFRQPDGSLRLVDFGIASMAAPEKKDAEELLLCSPAYAAPEVIRGERVDGRADVYALGITAFKLLTGRTPFAGSDFDKVFDAHLKSPMPDLIKEMPGIPRDLAVFVDRATRKDPSDRFTHARDVVDLLTPGARLAGVQRRGGLVLTLQFPPEEAFQVDLLLHDFKRSLEQHPRVEASFGELHPSTPDGKAPSEPPL